MAELSHIKVINNALARIGSAPIFDEAEDTELAAKAVSIYYAKLDAVLGLHDWSFARKTYRLDQVPETTDNDYDPGTGKFVLGWRHAFAMPGGRLSPPLRVLTDPRMPDDPLRHFFVEQDRIYADHKPLWATFTVRAAPSVWKPDFVLALTVAVAADLCVPVSHDAGLADNLREQAEGSPQMQGRGGLIARALANDAAGARSKAPIWRDPLTQARMG